VFSLTGPSALVSWLEPLLLQLNFRIQVATQALADREAVARALAVVSCEQEKRIALETLEAVGVKPVPISVDSEGYSARVLAVVRELVAAVEDPSRIFEVGLRAATCLEQHELALRACLEAGREAHQQRVPGEEAGDDSGGHHGPRARAALRLGRGGLPRHA
jgi:hypothetical protein